MVIRNYIFSKHPNKLPSISSKAALLSSVGDLQQFLHELKLEESQNNAASSASISIWNASENQYNITGNNYDTLTLTKSLFDSDVGHIVNVIDANHRSKEFTLKQHLFDLFKEIKFMFKSMSTILVVIMGGMAIGVMAAWGAVLQDMIGENTPLNMNDADVGIIGFIGTIACVFGGLIIGPVVDKWFAKRLKMVILVLFIGIIISFGVLLFIVPSPWSDESIIFMQNKKMIVLSYINGAGGLFVGGCLPLFYELCVEVSYPVSEGSSATFLVFIENISLLIFVGIADWISTKWETILVMVTCVLCVILLIFVKDRYRRM